MRAYPRFFGLSCFELSSNNISSYTGALILSFLAFFLVTTVTSLIVRVLTSSGVALMFPLFSFFRRMGMRYVNNKIVSVMMYHFLISTNAFYFSTVERMREFLQ